jgi:hypothetical protein
MAGFLDYSNVDPYGLGVDTQLTTPKFDTSAYSNTGGFWDKLNANLGKKVGGTGLFQDMSRGDLALMSGAGQLVGNIEDSMNKGKDLMAQARLAPTENLLRTGRQLPTSRNDSREAMASIFGLNDQLQNIADAEQKANDAKILNDFLSRSMVDLNRSRNPIKR